MPGAQAGPRQLRARPQQGQGSREGRLPKQGAPSSYSPFSRFPRCVCTGPRRWDDTAPESAPLPGSLFFLFLFFSLSLILCCAGVRPCVACCVQETGCFSDGIRHVCRAAGRICREVGQSVPARDREEEADACLLEAGGLRAGGRGGASGVEDARVCRAAGRACRGVGQSVPARGREEEAGACLLEAGAVRTGGRGGASGQGALQDVGGLAAAAVQGNAVAALAAVVDFEHGVLVVGVGVHAVGLAGGLP